MNDTQTNSLVAKWSDVLNGDGAPKIRGKDRMNLTAQLLENTQNEMLGLKPGQTQLNEDSAPTNGVGAMATYNPILMAMVRRAVPNLIAYDVVGTQAMTGPTQYIFAFRPLYTDKVTGNNDPTKPAFYNEADTSHSGTGTHSTPADMFDNAFSTGRGMATSVAETLGSDGEPAFAEMGFEIEKFSVEAKTRALKAKYSIELAQDMKALHGLDAESELIQILAAEVIAEKNREIIRTIYQVAKVGAQNNDLTTPGEFDLDTDSNGRWSVEKFKGLLFQIERDANAIARETRRGKGNVIICTSDVASSLVMAGLLDYTPALSTDLEVDDTGNTFVGILNRKYKVYIDPYMSADANFYVVGYRGASKYDAGIFYCPYVPLQLFKAIDDTSFQPKLAFKTRYGLVANPFANGQTKGGGLLTPNSNVYYRKVKVKNLT